MSHFQPSRQVVVIASVLLVGGAFAWLAGERSGCRSLDAGFWFEDVSYNSARLGGPITAQEVETIVSVARSELTDAFARLNITLSDRRDATHRVRVVQELGDMRLRYRVGIPAESRAVAGFGGQGSVSFSWFASGALTYAPEDARRSAMIEAIGRGIGRAAVHEFVHLLLPTAPIHDSTDIESYEYRSAARREQYFGEMHWDLAWPLLQERIGRCGNGLKP